ncbi:MAG TPA: class F sortase [Gaiellaceae bacterium]|nr:class F sortase [Gaiellaceae bacterium]
MGVRPPVRVSVPALGLEAKVVPVGVESNGELELPRTGRVAGWYRFGSEPGRPGTAVIAAHVDYAARRGVFYQLPTLEPGARVSVRWAGRRTRHFRVIARRSYGKQALPRRLFARGGKPALALVTCGGAFDEATRRYAENVVVWAVPVT